MKNSPDSHFESNKLNSTEKIAAFIRYLVFLVALGLSACAQPCDEYQHPDTKKLIELLDKIDDVTENPSEEICTVAKEVYETVIAVIGPGDDWTYVDNKPVQFLGADEDHEEIT